MFVPLINVVVVSLSISLVYNLHLLSCCLSVCRIPFHSALNNIVKRAIPPSENHDLEFLTTHHPLDCFYCSPPKVLAGPGTYDGLQVNKYAFYLHNITRGMTLVGFKLSFL